MRFVIITVVVLTVAAVAGAVLLRSRDMHAAAAARAAALSADCGCALLPGGVWAWRLGAEESEEQGLHGSAVEVAALLGVPFMRIAAALPESWLTAPCAADGAASAQHPEKSAVAAKHVEEEAPPEEAPCHDTGGLGEELATLDEETGEATPTHGDHSASPAAAPAPRPATPPAAEWRGCGDDVAPDAPEVGATALMHAALLAHGLATRAEVEAQQALYRARLKAAPAMEAAYARYFAVCTELLRPGAVLGAARNWWPLARAARLALLVDDAGCWDAHDGVATALMARFSAEKFDACDTPPSSLLTGSTRMPSRRSCLRCLPTAAAPTRCAAGRRRWRWQSSSPNR